jgi:hypothetical protein
MNHATLNLHRATKIEIQPLEKANESKWRDIVIHFEDGGEFEVTVFTNQDDLEVETD